MTHNYLRKLAYSCLFTLVFISTTLTSRAQHFEQFATGVVDFTSYVGNSNNYYQVQENYGDSMRFYFTGLASGAYSDITLRFYYEGDFGDGGEYADVYAEGNYMGSAGPYPSGGDCSPEDSVDIIVPLATFLSWAADDSVYISAGYSPNVDPFLCSNPNWSRVKIIYEYCIFGTPAQYATITLTDSVACATDAPIALSGVPAGGTFTGTGVSGASFDPTGLPSGNYEITYTATDGIGCTTVDHAIIKINYYPFIPDIQICPGTAAVFTSLPGTIVFANDINFTSIIDTATNTFTSGILNQTTTFYTAGLDANDIFVMDAITATGAIVVDHDALSGDDRGGIAVTDSFVYIVGDNNTVRYDLDMTGGMSLPIRDGIVSNLKDLTLYTLWSTITNEAPDNIMGNFPITINSLRTLNADLSYGSTYMNFSAPITMDYGSSIFAGYGYIGLYSASDSHFYIIDTDNGQVTDLGANPGFDNYGSENWSDWGILEYDGTNFSIVYRSYTYYDALTRMQLPSGPETDAYPFPGGLNDLTSLTYNPQNHRWYTHHEGGTSTFGGSSETGIAADATHITTPLPTGGASCPGAVTAHITDIDMGNDTSVCESDVPLILEAGFGFASYTWNGVNNNWNVYPVTEAGNYIVDAVDNIGCHIMDTIHVTLDACIGIEENETFSLSIYPNPSNGNFNIVSEITEEGTAEIEITDLQGRKIFTRLFEMTAGIKTIPVELTNVMDGVYLVNIQMNNHKKTLRLIIKQ